MTAEEVRAFPALSTMERQTPPLRYGRFPYWRAPICPASAEVMIPSWNWTSPLPLAEGTEFVTLDANAAYLGALGQVTIGHSHLEHVGPWDVLPDPRKVSPGYYRIRVPYWAFSATIVHPLGNTGRAEEDALVWVAGPTLQLLLELTDDGSIAGVEITDSWVAAAHSDFRAWANRLKSVRTEVLDRRDVSHARTPDPDHECYECRRYDAFKLGYSQAFSLMLTGEKCKTLRPDWSHTVYAMHAANTWRKAWRYTFTGRPLVSMGAVDEISVIAGDLHHVLAQPKPPFRYDDTGRAVGAMKAKAHGRIEDTTQDASAVPFVTEDGEPLL